MLSLRMTEKIIILDFGSQYTQLIARRVLELDVYCEIHTYNHLPEFDQDVKGVILSGSSCSVRDQDAPQIDLTPICDNYPLLGVCYGAQYLAQHAGGEVRSEERRVGKERVNTRRSRWSPYHYINKIYSRIFSYISAVSILHPYFLY